MECYMLDEIPSSTFMIICNTAIVEAYKLMHTSNINVLDGLLGNQ